MTMLTARIRTVPVATQDYVSVCYGDARIDTYITEPAGGVQGTTGLLLLIHGWGNDGSEAFAGDSVQFADRYDVVVTRVEFRQSGREAHNPTPGESYSIPYDMSKLQTIDCLRAAYATLARYPQLDRTRCYLWGGSQGAYLSAQCLIFAPHLWAAAMLVSGLYQPMTYAQSREHGFSRDLTARPGFGFVDCALGLEQTFSPAEEDIRNPFRNAELMPAHTPVVLMHSTHDEVVDVKHSVTLYARLLSLRRPVQFHPVEYGDHGLVWQTFQEETHAAAILQSATEMLYTTHRPDATLYPAQPVSIPVRDGVFTVTFSVEGPTLGWRSDSTTLC